MVRVNNRGYNGALLQLCRGGYKGSVNVANCFLCDAL